jgi:hypothetical protein
MVVRGAGALTAGVALAGGAVRSAAAHHSFPATYDTAQRVTVSGVVQLVRFTNPHVHVVIESPLESAPAADPAVESAFEAAAAAAEAAGEPVGEPAGEAAATVPDAPPADEVQAPAEPPPSTLWMLDGPAPARARTIGLTPEALPPGTPLTVLAWPARTAGSHDLAPLIITLDGGARTIRVR